MVFEQDLEGRAEALQVEKGSVITLFKKRTGNSHSVKLKSTEFKKTGFLKQISHCTLLA